MYAGTTPGIYRLPFWQKGERSSGSSNYRAARIVENQLTAASVLYGESGVIAEGTYTGLFATGASSVTLTTGILAVALRAIIGRKYVSQATTLQWTDLPDNSTIYLYAQTVESNIYAANQQSTLQDMVCRAVWNTTGLTPAESVLLAKVTTTGVAITIDSSATITDNGDFAGGKPIYYSFAGHRTASPIDHPNKSVTDAKLADEAVLSRALAPWDGTTSGTDTASGKGVGTGHLKNLAVTLEKLALTGGGTLPIVADATLTGLLVASSGVTTPGVLSGGTVAGGTIIGQLRGTDVALLASGLDVQQPTLLRGGATVQGGATIDIATIRTGIITELSQILLANSGLDALGALIARSGATVQGGLGADDVVATTAFVSWLRSRTTVASGLDVYDTTDFRNAATFRALMDARGFSNTPDFMSGLYAYFGNVHSHSGVRAETGFSGRIPFYRKAMGFVAEPLFTSVDELLFPGFVYPGAVTEVMVAAQIAPTAPCVFELRNAAGGGGTALTVTLLAGQRYASGLGLLPMDDPNTELAFRPTTVGAPTSGLNVYLTGFQHVPSPSALTT